jgi:hypothetical protein
LEELLEVWVQAKRREIRAGIDCGEIAVPGVERFLQRGHGFRFIALSSVGRTQPDATPNTAMTHIAIQEQLNGKAVEWMEKVTDEQYRK